jgi:cbb3-type cytochrome oxidase maturation protein
MGIILRIRIGMVKPVHHPIRIGTQVRRSLKQPGKGIKELFPALAHRKHLMGRIAVQEKCLDEQGEVPVTYKEEEYRHFLCFIFYVAKLIPQKKNNDDNRHLLPCSSSLKLPFFSDCFVLEIKNMGIILLLIGVSISVALCFLGCFLWAVKNGQYDDDFTPSIRILFDDKKIENS